ncbi:MAG: glycolate oxidase iron-sulfur subunit [Saprospiraceae bacterium]|jgi:glycolate oxidase iron-sulfur subunit
MDIHLAKSLTQNSKAETAAQLLRRCVHCGFCNATCPTYQLLGDEADGPRGRIYLMKQMLESGEADSRSRLHLDRCLMCRSCETTCPSGVEYSSLLELGRELHQDLAPRPIKETLQRKLLTSLLLNTQPLKATVKVGQLLRPVLPLAVQQKLPDTDLYVTKPTTLSARKMLMLKGCVQASIAPNTNAATVRVMDKLGVNLIEPAAGCCGAMRLHTNGHEQGLKDIKRLIDQWWPTIEQGVEAIIFTASGCGVTIKDYGDLLKDDELYAEKAQHISELAMDISKVIAREFKQRDKVPMVGRAQRVAFQSPCTLQHGLKLNGVVEKILSAVGYIVLPVNDGHLCCGSAGTYSIFQKELSQQLAQDKVQNLTTDKPDVIATANIGCQLQLKSNTTVKVVHWIELIEAAISNK